MSALLKVITRSSVTLDGMHGGSDTALFTSGSAPSSVSTQSSGALTELFKAQAYVKAAETAASLMGES